MILLLGATAALHSGCLLSPPPSYEGPKRTKPFLAPVPEGTGIQRVEPGTTATFWFRVTSEDNGDPVLFMAYRDFAVVGSEQRVVNPSRIDPATFDACEEVEPDGTDGPGPGDTTSCRTYSATWTVPDALSGCHFFTVVATHESNHNRYGQCEHPSSNEGDACFLDPADVGKLTFILDVRHLGAAAAALDTCPTYSEVPRAP